MRLYNALYHPGGCNPILAYCMATRVSWLGGIEKTSHPNSFGETPDNLIADVLINQHARGGVVATMLEGNFSSSRIFVRR